MARKQYLAIHRYHSDEVKKQFLTPPPQQDWQTDLEWAQGWTFEKAKCLGYWVGNDDFFFVIGVWKTNKIFTMPCLKWDWMNLL